MGLKHHTIDDGRFKACLPSGIIKNPKLIEANVDLFVNDVVILRNDKVEPMYDNGQEMYGVIAANAKKGQKILIAARELK